MTLPDVDAVENLAGAVRVELDEALYPMEAIYAAAYVFIDRAYVLLDRPRAGRLRVTLADKQADAAAPRDEAGLRAVVEELTAQLRSTTRRHRLTSENRALVEAVTLQAISPSPAPGSPPSLDELEAFDFTSEKFEDPLGIAQSWEEKYRKKAPDEDAAAAAAKKDEETK